MVGGKRTLDVFFPPKKPEMNPGRWWAVVGYTLEITL
jgi:hypothetical protein